MSYDFWTPLDGELKRLHATGISRGKIAKALTESLGLPISKNAVVGRLHRLGIYDPAKAPKSLQNCDRKSGSRRRARIKKRLPPIVVAPPPSPPDPEVRTKAFAKKITCAWPIGEPSGVDFRFCDEPAERAKPYCGVHCQMAYKRLTPFVHKESPSLQSV
jgi:GcrA cell cycle regulator